MIVENSHHGATYPVGRRPEGGLDEVDAVAQDGLFLLGRHGDGILVPVAVDHADLVTRRDDLLDLLGESLDRVTRDEPGRLDAVPLEQVEDARDVPTSPANRPREMSSGESPPP